MSLTWGFASWGIHFTPSERATAVHLIPVSFLRCAKPVALGELQSSIKTLLRKIFLLLVFKTTLWEEVFVFFLIFSWRIMVYIVVLVSALQQRDSAISILVFPPSWPFLPPPTPSPLFWAVSEHQVEFHVLYSNFPLPSILQWWCICFSATFSICPTLSFPNCVQKPVAPVCVSIPALQIGSSVPFF